MPKRSKKQESEILSKIPEQFKLTLPSISLDKYPDIAYLQGDYILSLFSSQPSRLSWRLRFDPVCGYRQMTLLLRRHRDESWTLGLNLSGGPESVFWKKTHVDDLGASHTLDLQNAERNSGSWPAKLIIEPIAVARSALSSSLSNECVCLSAGYEKVKVKFNGVVDALCTECDTFANWRELEQGGVVDCSWWLEDLICYDNIPPVVAIDEFYVLLYVHEDCVVEVWVEIDTAGAPEAIYIKDIPLQVFDITKIPTIDLYLDNSTTACTFGSSTADVKFIRTSIPGCPSICGNFWGLCKPNWIPLPVIDQPCEINV